MEGSRRRILYALLALVVVVYICQVLYYRNYTNDDAYITLRYSRFLAMGIGPYFNIGEHVEGYTNFSLMALLAILIRGFGAGVAMPAAKVIGVVCGTGSILLTFSLARYLLRKSRPKDRMADVWAVGAAGLVAISPAFSLNSTSGLETTLFALCLVGAVFIGFKEADRGVWMGSGLLFGASVLTRPEGILLFTVFWTAQAALLFLRSDRLSRASTLAASLRQMISTGPVRVLLLNGTIVSVVLAGHLAFRYLVYDGALLPNTFYAKAGGLPGTSAMTYIADGVAVPVLGLAGILAAVAGHVARRDYLPVVLPLGLVAAAGTFLPLLTGAGWMPGWRLVMPYLPLVAVFVAVGWAHLMGQLPFLKPRFELMLMVFLLLSVGVAQASRRTEFYERVETRARGYEHGHSALAQWLNDQSRGRPLTVAMMDIGIVGFECPNSEMIDITGLTDRYIARCDGGFLQKDYDPDYILERRPDFIILTLTGPRRGKDRGGPSGRLRCWTPVEDRIYSDPEFRRSYLRHLPVSPSPDDRFAGLAQSIGAERIFDHDYPDSYYLLAVFRYGETYGNVDAENTRWEH